MTPGHFHDLYRELMDENPFTLRAVLKVLELKFTDAVATLAVTVEERPRMLVNLGFIQASCQTEDEVKALICHEFLHVLLRHTEQRQPQGGAEHIAQDAVINAIIHRQLGPAYSSLMSRYYARAEGVRRLLRPPRRGETVPGNPMGVRENQLRRAWRALYEGRLVADDITSLAASFPETLQGSPVQLFGSHRKHGPGPGACIPPVPELAEALARTLETINADGIWRECAGRGVGVRAPVYRSPQPASAGVERWRKDALAILRKHLLPDPQGVREAGGPAIYRLPVLSPTDRRASIRALWSPFLPEAAWPTSQPRAKASAQVYLDASGSMHHEMPLIIRLLAQLSSHIRRPFWAFSNVVAPAQIEHGQLVTSSTGGTTFSCVLEHLVQTRPAAAVVITDGYIERQAPELVAAASHTRLHVILTCTGNPSSLREAGIGFTQLARVPV